MLHLLMYVFLCLFFISVKLHFILNLNWSINIKFLQKQSMLFLFACLFICSLNVFFHDSVFIHFPFTYVLHLYIIYIYHKA